MHDCNMVLYHGASGSFGAVDNYKQIFDAEAMQYINLINLIHADNRFG